VPLTNLRLFRALSHRPIFILWTGEAFSNIGDEIYKVALIWIAVKLIGADAGYIAAAQAASILFFGLVGGLLADRWDPRRTMYNSDLLRGLIVMIPVIWLYFFSVNLVLLFAVAISVAGISAFFEPALQAVVPRLVANRELRQATNGLMGTTPRLARAVGPAIVGLLTGLMPTVHFFTLDAITFGFSALAISRLKPFLPLEIRRQRKKSGVFSEVASGFSLIREDKVMRYVLYSKSVASGAWSIITPLGIALLVQANFPGNIRVYGFLLAAYGMGNLGAALYLSNITMLKPLRMMGNGFVLMGFSFIAMALTKNIPAMMFFAALAAVGGPMNDLAHIDIIQNRYPPSELVRVVRFRMAVEYAGIFLSLLLAPICFRIFPPQIVLSIAGAAIAVAGGWGLVRHAEK
jgi:DHA3 family macrolide efflux protein-like MFS transporter